MGRSDGTAWKIPYRQAEQVSEKQPDMSGNLRLLTIPLKIKIK